MSVVTNLRPVNRRFYVNVSLSGETAVDQGVVLNHATRYAVSREIIMPHVNAFRRRIFNRAARDRNVMAPGFGITKPHTMIVHGRINQAIPDGNMVQVSGRVGVTNADAAPDWLIQFKTLHGKINPVYVDRAANAPITGQLRSSAADLRLPNSRSRNDAIELLVTDHAKCIRRASAISSDREIGPRPSGMAGEIEIYRPIVKRGLNCAPADIRQILPRIANAAVAIRVPAGIDVIIGRREQRAGNEK